MELREGLPKGNNHGHGSGIRPSGKGTEELLNIANTVGSGRSPLVFVSL